MELNLFKSPVFSVCIIVTVVRSIALFGGVFLLPLFLQQLMGFDEIRSGLIMLPGSLIIGFIMPFSGKLSENAGPRTLATLGLIFVAVFMFMYRNLDINTSTWGVILPTLIRGVGIAILMAPIMATAMNAVPTSKAGMASSMLNLMQQVGGSLGIAILATVLSHRVHYHLDMTASAFNTNTPAYQQALQRAVEHALTLGYSHQQAYLVARSMIGKTIGESAQVLAFQDAFIVGGIIVVLAVLPALRLPNKTSKHVSLEMAVME